MLSNETRYSIGIAAEDIVANYLQNIGYAIIARRWKSKYGEIDIVARTHEQIIFVEVKATKKRSSEEDLVLPKQRKRNSLAALDFLGQYDATQNCNIRFDCAMVKQGILERYIQSAWYIEAE